MCAGGLSAGIFMLALSHPESLLFFVVYLTAIPLYVAGLGAGALAGLITALTGTAALFLTQPSNIAVIYIFTYALPAVVLIFLALRFRIGAMNKVFWYPEGSLFASALMFPCLIFLTFIGLTFSHEGGLLALSHQHLVEMMEPVKTKMSANMAVEFSAMLEKIVVFMPALIGILWALVTMGSIAVAQNVLQRQKLNIRDEFMLQRFHVPQWMIYAVAITGIVGASNVVPYNYIAANLSLILGLPFLFVGLAVIHAWAATRKYKTGILLLFYGLLSLPPLSVILGILTALIGVIDQWANFRHKLPQKQR